jgi:large subunit ribosomal protein L30
MPKKAAGTTAKRSTKTTKKTTTRKRATESAEAPATARGRKPKTASALRVRQVRSGLGHAATYRRTLRALGLKHHQDEVVLPDNPSVRGMVHKVRHLVRVAPEEA